MVEEFNAIYLSFGSVIHKLWISPFFFLFQFFWLFDYCICCFRRSLKLQNQRFWNGILPFGMSPSYQLEQLLVSLFLRVFSIFMYHIFRPLDCLSCSKVFFFCTFKFMIILCVLSFFIKHLFCTIFCRTQVSNELSSNSEILWWGTERTGKNFILLISRNIFLH